MSLSGRQQGRSKSTSVVAAAAFFTPRIQRSVPRQNYAALADELPRQNPNRPSSPPPSNIQVGAYSNPEDEATDTVMTEAPPGHEDWDSGEESDEDLEVPMALVEEPNWSLEKKKAAIDKWRKSRLTHEKMLETRLAT